MHDIQPLEEHEGLDTVRDGHFAAQGAKLLCRGSAHTKDAHVWRDRLPTGICCILVYYAIVKAQITTPVADSFTHALSSDFALATCEECP